METRRRKSASYLFWIAFAVLAAQTLYLARQWDQAAQAVDRAIAPVSDVARFEDGGTRIFLDNDPYYWLTYAREMVESGRWRIRITNVDNTPYGREVHWSQSISWLLIALGYSKSLATGAPLLSSIEQAAVWVNPILFIGLLLAAGRVVFRRLGAIPAAMLMLLLASQFDIGWNFHALRPDHQSLHLAFMLMSFLLLILGGAGLVSDKANRRSNVMIRGFEAPDSSSARRCMLASGVLGGLGLWTGATIVFAGMLIVGAGCVLLVLFMPAREKIEQQGHEYDPAVWMWWGLGGAVTSVLFYLLEYAPNHFGMRMEVNHPIYAVSWFCLAAFIALLTHARSGRPASIPGHRLWIGLAAAGAVLPLLAVFLGPVEWHNLRNIEMLRLHNFINEFYTFSNATRGKPLMALVNTFGVLPLSLVGALFMASDKRTTIPEWAAVWLSFFLCMFFTAAAFRQVRWLPMCAATTIWLTVVLGVVLWRPTFSSGGILRRAAWIIGVVVLLTQSTLFIVREQIHARLCRNLESVHRDFVKAALMKQTAQRLGAAGPGLRVLCEPDLAGPFYYFGKVQSLTSYYWENTEGLRSAADIFADRDGTSARQAARERGLTHIIIPRKAEMAEIFTYVRYGLLNHPQAAQTLAASLAGNGRPIPEWLEQDSELQPLTQAKFTMTGWLNRSRGLETRLSVFRVKQE